MGRSGTDLSATGRNRQMTDAKAVETMRKAALMGMCHTPMCR